MLKKGLKHDTPVKIKGFESIYFVKYKMHSKTQNQIDIYMRFTIQVVKEWGEKYVRVMTLKLFLIDYKVACELIRLKTIKLT